MAAMADTVVTIHTHRNLTMAAMAVWVVVMAATEAMVVMADTAVMEVTTAPVSEVDTTDMAMDTVTTLRIAAAMVDMVAMEDTVDSAGWDSVTVGKPFPSTTHHIPLDPDWH